MWGQLWGNVSATSYLVEMKFSLLAVTDCPRCNTKGSLRKILWGMPDKEPDQTKYVVGGCCISDNDPEYACINCDWQGLLGNERAK
jgi:hypothetical protein